MKVEKYEKQLAKAFINMYIAKGYDPDELDAATMEYEIMKITGNNEHMHRYDLEDYIKSEIEKLL